MAWVLGSFVRWRRLLPVVVHYGAVLRVGGRGPRWRFGGGRIAPGTCLSRPRRPSPLPEVPGRRRTAVAAGPSLLAEEGSHHWGSRIRLSRSAVSGGDSDLEGVVAVRRRACSCRPVRLGRWPALGLGRRRHLRRGGLISPGTSRRSRGNLMDSLASPSVRDGAAPVWGAVRRRAGGAGSLVGDG